jgi:hypothetical protein
VLPVLADTAVPRGHMTALLPVLLQARRHRLSARARRRRRRGGVVWGEGSGGRRGNPRRGEML